MLIIFLNVFLYIQHWPCMKGYKRKIWDPYVMDVQGESNVPLHLEKKWHDEGVAFTIQILNQGQLNFQVFILSNTFIAKKFIVHGEKKFNPSISAIFS
jgi:hypothetical protein